MIQGIEQPAIIQIDNTLRLRKYDGVHDFALEWYLDEETVYLVDGKRDPYTMERLGGMYRYLNNAGELYFIEVLENGTYKPIGDVTFWQEDMPIVIGDRNYRGKKIGRPELPAKMQVVCNATLHSHGLSLPLLQKPADKRISYSDENRMPSYCKLTTLLNKSFSLLHSDCRLHAHHRQAQYPDIVKYTQPK